jgi:hypothetical protein
MLARGSTLPPRRVNGLSTTFRGCLSSSLGADANAENRLDVTIAEVLFSYIVLDFAVRSARLTLLLVDGSCGGSC